MSSSAASATAPASLKMQAIATTTEQRFFWACLEGCDTKSTNLATGTLRVCRWIPKDLREEEILVRLHPNAKGVFPRWSVAVREQK